MAGRIISMQRQARELGRLRTGYTDTSGTKPRPVKSQTWVVTSHAEHYVQSAADAWGGAVENWQPLGGGAPQWRVITKAVALDAILPPGDPLSQAYELWSGGGCARRCDGITETLSDSPCLCRAQHGEDFHEQRKGTVCAATTRLNVFLPEMPDVGVFRVETHSYYAAGEMAGAVDLIRSAVGPDAVIPIRLRIEQRQRKAGGQTKNFPVVVVELRGITTGQVLGASVMGGQELAAQAQREAIGAGRQPAAAAIEAAPQAVAPQPAAPAAAALEEKPSMSADEQAVIIQQLADVADVEALREMWRGVMATFHIPSDGPVALALQARAAELTTPAPAPEPAPVDTSGDADALWARIQAAVPENWSPAQIEKDFAQFTGTPVEVAGAADMASYLQHISNGGSK